jgi:predicted nucleic acid-binding protein
MPPVICNAGPLMALGKLNRLDVLAGLYGVVQIPESVYIEVVVNGLLQGEADAAIVRSFWRQQRWPVVSVTDAVMKAYQPLVKLGDGEQAVLALALATPGSLALLDDVLARREARRLHLQSYGTLGILMSAYQSGLLTRQQLVLLIQDIAARPDIWISAALCQQLLATL